MKWLKMKWFEIFIKPHIEYKRLVLDMKKLVDSQKKINWVKVKIPEEHYKMIQFLILNGLKSIDELYDLIDLNYKRQYGEDIKIGSIFRTKKRKFSVAGIINESDEILIVYKYWSKNSKKWFYEVESKEIFLMKFEYNYFWSKK